MSFFKGLKEGINYFTNTIAIIVSTFLLIPVYFIGVGLTSIIAKLLKKHFLQTNISKEEKSYWTNLDLKKKPIEKYYRQF